MDVLQKDRDTLTQSINKSYLGRYFPKELNGLVVDYAALTAVYDILLEKDPSNPSHCPYYETELVVPGTRPRLSWNISLRSLHITYPGDDDKNELDTWEDRKQVSILGYLDEGSTVRFLINGNRIRGLPNLAIPTPDCFPSLQMSQGDATEHGVALIKPFAPRTRLFLKHICSCE